MKETCKHCPLYKVNTVNYKRCRCSVNNTNTKLNDICVYLDGMEMKYREACKILHHYQKWRRGAKTEPLHPKIIGLAIDAAIKGLRDISKYGLQVKGISAAGI